MTEQQDGDQPTEEDKAKAKEDERMEIMAEAADMVRDLRKLHQVSQLTFEAQCDAMDCSSKLLRARYESLMGAGFDDHQAMHLITQRGLS